VIEIRQVRKTYGRIQALDTFDLQVGRGELYGLVGPNGAGKTTLIKILATLVRPDSGEVRISGHEVSTKPRAVRAMVGYMPDVPGLYQDMRVIEFLEFFADAFHVPSHEKPARIERELERAGLGARANSFVEELSLGMKQRLLLAKTLLHDPQVLLLDEPATGLDPLGRIELRDRLTQLNRDGVTTLISSHILSDLEDICTQVAFIDQGRNTLDAEGRPVLVLQGLPEASLVTCEVAILGEPHAAVAAVEGFPGARVVTAAPGLLRIELIGGSQAAAKLLRHLTSAGVDLVRFDARGPALEDRYRSLFGGAR
jgi:ABC-2 type transport system ATP-binding protein